MRASLFRDVLCCATLLLGPGCFAPNRPPGSPCLDDNSCLADQTCRGGVCEDTDAAPADAAPPPRDAPVSTVSCAAQEVCAAARGLGAVSGDTGAARVTASGHRGAWLRVRVTEDDTDVPGRPTRITAALTTAATSPYELRVHVDPTRDVLECATTLGTVTTSGASQQVHAQWGEDSLPNGASDSRDVVLEIRPVGAACDPSATWTLAVTGNAE